MAEQASVKPRVLLVTGATSGIGRAVAIKLASDGFMVIVHGRDAERGAATVRAIEETGRHARFMAADLGDADDVIRLAIEAGDVDVLVNNGGFSWFGPTAELEPATFDALSPPMCARLTSSWQRSRRAWPIGDTGASSASTRWPGASVWPAVLRTEPPKRH